MSTLENNFIDYGESRAYIGFAKLPLIKNENGIGFLGVKIQNEDRTKIQCYECGNWIKRITTNHLKTHGISLTEYKNKYGFNLQTPMTSDESSLISSNNMLGLKHSFKNNKSIQKRGLKALRVHWENKTPRPISAEEKNRLGTCSEQIKERMRSFIVRFKRLPSPLGVGEDSATLWSLLRHRFGSVNAGLTELDLPTRKQQGSHVEYLFKDGKTIKCGYFHNNYDQLVEKIKSESNLFRQPELLLKTA